MITYFQRKRTAREKSRQGPVSRVRHHLQMVTGRPESTDSGQISLDVRRLLVRLRRLQAKGGVFQKVELSSHVQEAFKTLQVVGNELLVLFPERRGA